MIVLSQFPQADTHFVKSCYSLQTIYTHLGTLEIGEIVDV